MCVSGAALGFVVIFGKLRTESVIVTEGNAKLQYVERLSGFPGISVDTLERSRWITGVVRADSDAAHLQVERYKPGDARQVQHVRQMVVKRIPVDLHFRLRGRWVELAIPLGTDYLFLLIAGGYK